MFWWCVEQHYKVDLVWDHLDLEINTLESPFWAVTPRVHLAISPFFQRRQHLCPRFFHYNLYCTLITFELRLIYTVNSSMFRIEIYTRKIDVPICNNCVCINYEQWSKWTFLWSKTLVLFFFWLYAPAGVKIMYTHFFYILVMSENAAVGRWDPLT